MIMNTWRKAINHKIWFIAALLTLGYFLLIGFPLPPSLLFRASEWFLSGQPGYTDFLNGFFTQDQVIANVDVYLSYLWKFLVVVVANIFIDYILFALAIAITWNYIFTGNISPARFLRLLYFNLVQLFVLGPFLMLFYLGASTLAKIPLTFLSGLGIFILVVCLIAFISLSILTSALFCKYGEIRKTVLHAINLSAKYYFQLIGTFVAAFFLLSVSSWIVSIFIKTQLLQVLFILLLQFIVFAWLHLYVGETLKSESKNKI